MKHQDMVKSLKSTKSLHPSKEGDRPVRHKKKKKRNKDILFTRTWMAQIKTFRDFFEL